VPRHEAAPAIAQSGKNPVKSDIRRVIAVCGGRSRGMDQMHTLRGDICTTCDFFGVAAGGLATGPLQKARNHVPSTFFKIGAAGAVIVASTLPATNAVAADDDTLCTIVGTVKTTGMSYAPAPGKYTLDGTTDCSSGHKGTGKVTGHGAGTIGCSGGKNEAVLTVAWKDGSSSTLNVSMADFAYGSGGVGKVTKGALKGSSVGLSWAREAAGAEAKCAAGGIKTYQFAGGMALS
jgi:hypothetical protein